jgi:hypothetical protein
MLLSELSAELAGGNGFNFNSGSLGSGFGGHWDSPSNESTDEPDFRAFPARWRGLTAKKHNKLGLFPHMGEKA